MSRFIFLFTLAAFSLECWGAVNWGAWFWGPAIAVNTVNIGLGVMKRCLPRTWRTFRRELGMYRDVITRWILENALKWKQGVSNASGWRNRCKRTDKVYQKRSPIVYQHRTKN